jgi:hypothetical protein
MDPAFGVFESRNIPAPGMFRARERETRGKTQFRTRWWLDLAPNPEQIENSRAPLSVSSFRRWWLRSRPDAKTSSRHPLREASAACIRFGERSFPFPPCHRGAFCPSPAGPDGSQTPLSWNLQDRGTKAYYLGPSPGRGLLFGEAADLAMHRRDPRVNRCGII